MRVIEQSEDSDEDIHSKNEGGDSASNEDWSDHDFSLVLDQDSQPAEY